MLLIFSCKNEEKGITTDLVNNPATESVDNDNKGLPKIEFERTSFDFGVIEQGEIVSHTYKFKNTGSSDLIITKVAATCGCTVPKYSKEPIAPGKEGVVEVIFDSAGRNGMQHKSLTIVSNNQPNKMELTFVAEIIKM